jgi:hypothetical protein
MCGCGNESRPGQRYCKLCHARYMREYRKVHELSTEQRMKSNARAYLHVYIKRGKVTKQPCCICGNFNSEAHHEDYSQPLKVRWYCRKHHLEKEH